jgi:NAD(P)-dependent dehydrogenase (short-subunit alcohol dehydrogenase family)
MTQPGQSIVGSQTRQRDSESLDGLRVAITGGTSGLGLALVQEFQRRGAQVAFVARTRARVGEVTESFPGAHGIVGDVSVKQDIYRIAFEILGPLGGLDVLINNASDLGPVPLALLADTECEDFVRAIDTNLLGPFRLTRALLGALASSAREGRGAVVINISSDAAVNTYVSWGSYGASKAALAHMTRIWNEEMQAEGVRLHAVDPGDMDTPMHAAALPDADVASLKQPSIAAREIVQTVMDLLPERSQQIAGAA